MPELPEVEIISRGLRPKLVGRTLVRVIQRRADLRIPLPNDLVSRLEGRRIERIKRRAKYLLLTIDDGSVVIIHLGMSGRLVITSGPTFPSGPHDHVIFETNEGQIITYNDPRRFGLITLSTGEDVDKHPLLRHLGPDPLNTDFDGAYLSAVLKGRRTAIKSALLDQRVIAGLGNIYASEALFEAKISPRRISNSVAGVRAERLSSAICEVLNQAIDAGGSSLRDYVQTTGELGYFQHHFTVYGREGKPCKVCGKVIRRLVQTGRSTYFCRMCQR